MNPELTKAITERLALGHTKDMIRDELLQAGYDGAVVEAIITRAQSLTSSTTGTGEVLPTATDLFSAGWQFARRYHALVVLLAIPLLLLEVAAYVQETNQTYAEISSLVVAVGSVVMLVVYFLVLSAALRLVMIDDGTTTYPLASVWGWVTKHVGGLLWVLFLSTLVIAGGFFLFIIPGIILSFLLYLAQYVYVVEGRRGLSALLRSRELVRGYGGLLFRRLLTLLLFFFLVMFGVGIVTGVVTYFMGIELLSFDPTGEFIFNLLGQVLSAVATVMGVKIGMVLYQSLAAVRPLGGSVEDSTKGKYTALAWLGLVGTVLLILAAATLVNLAPLMPEGGEKAEIPNFEAKQRALELRAEGA